MKKPKKQFMRKASLGLESEAMLVIDAIYPIGSVALLASHLQEVVREYLGTENKVCYTELHRGCPMEMRELKEGDLADGQPYLITIKLQEIYGRRK